MQNTISHGISKVAEFFGEDAPNVIVHGFTSPMLKSIGEREIIDEIRVIIHEQQTTAYFTFSSQMRPSLHLLRLYGPKNGLILDEQQQTVIKMKGASYKSYLQQFVPPLIYAREYIRNSLGNANRFFRRNFQADYGMRMLIKSFYDSIVEEKALPIPFSEILRTSRIMDDIFAQLTLLQTDRQLAKAPVETSPAAELKGEK